MRQPASPRSELALERRKTSTRHRVIGMPFEPGFEHRSHHVLVPAHLIDGCSFRAGIEFASIKFFIRLDGGSTVVNGYFPKGSGKDRDNSRVGYKLDFYQAVFDRAQQLRRRCPVLVIGDFNTAHREIDLARPKSNVKNSGFLPEERVELDRWLEAGWVDTFRALHPDQPDHYTWWRQWGGARERNVGWRIDYVLASPSAMERLKDAFIWPNERGSDHCPVGVDIDL